MSQMLPAFLIFSLLIFCSPASAAYCINISDEMGGAAAWEGIGDHPDSPWYMPFSMNDTPDTCIVIPVPTMQQHSEISCGACAAINNLRYWGEDGDEMTIAAEMGTVPVYGVNVESMAAWFENRGWTVESSTRDGDGSLELLREHLAAGIPTMVAWADWGGHWMVVAGYDTMGTETEIDDVIIFSDSYDMTDHTQDGYYRFPASRFYSLWFVPHWSPDPDSVRPWLTAVPPA